MTLEQIGSLLGITRERVRQIETEALRRLASDHDLAAAA
jgi:DNA-directed RNA polymerase sigma subunit (sigma70/sigma32)